MDELVVMLRQCLRTILNTLPVIRQYLSVYVGLGILFVVAVGVDVAYSFGFSF